MSEVPVVCSDGFSLVATVYAANRQSSTTNSKSNRGISAVVVSATGVTRGYYDAFCKFLAENAINAICFDFRGIGGSKPKSLVGFEATKRTWANTDIRAVLQYMIDRFPKDDLVYIGHSVGGHALAFVSDDPSDPYLKIKRVISISAPNVYWGLNTTTGAVKLLLLWGLIMPLMVWKDGYFSPKKLGMPMEDLPAGVALDWRRWSLQPKYVQGPGFQTLQVPMLVYSFTDDEFAIKRQVSYFAERLIVHTLVLGLCVSTPLVSCLASPNMSVWLLLSY
eukprot:TRINITY_DN2301_c0_g1_i1.p1 TRINITY_DN2301_c0_g1~~TRINITY_DN2301_c0_g1_i1.p1  ORF type:complete len:278 (+),score=19.71 TRINITY_DN2301_c0_g1_i1:107-940(+)